MEYYALQDGWIRISAQSFPMGRTLFQSESLLLGVNQLLLRINNLTVLIDTGLGNKWTLAETGLLGFKKPRQLMPQLESRGVSANDVNLIVLSHLHLDHAGGCTNRAETGDIEPAFPNAIYVCQQDELRFAQNPVNQAKGDYMPEDFEPLIAAGQLKTISGAGEIVKGVKVFPSRGHSPGHQVVLAEDDENAVFFPGDLFAVKEHTNLQTFTQYDLEPQKLMEERKIWLSRMEHSDWICCFCHHFRYPLGRYFNGKVIPCAKENS